MNTLVSVFERHPKKTLAMIVFFGFFAVVIMAETYLGWRNTLSERAGRMRYVRLRETPPLTAFPVNPNEHYRKTAGRFNQDKHWLRVDEKGFISPSRVHAVPDKTVVFLGGSTTECLFVEEGNRFPHLVGRLLEKNGRKVNSYNGGVAGNDTFHSANILLNKVIPLQPDIVVIMHNINDLSVLLREKTYWHGLPTRGVFIEETMGQSLSGVARQLKNLLIPNLHRKVRDFFLLVRAKLHREEDEFAQSRGKVTIDRKLMLSSFRKNLLTLIAICRAHDIVPVLMTEASRLTESPEEVVRGGMGNLPNDLDIEYDRLKELFDLFNETIRDVGRDSGVLVIDLNRAVPADRQYIYDVIHFTDKGSIMAAEVITGELDRHVLSRESSR